MAQELPCPLEAAMSAIKEQLAKDLAEDVTKTKNQIPVATRTNEQ